VVKKRQAPGWTAFARGTKYEGGDLGELGAKDLQEQIRDVSQTKIVSWPTPQDYNEALQNPSLSFTDSELQCGQAELTPLGLPKPVSGMFASVYKLRCGIKDWAVRCFLVHFPDQHERYEVIEQFLRAKSIPYMLGFDHQEEGLIIHGQRYPFLKMEWCYGVNLNTYIDRNTANPSKLSKLAESFKSVVLDLRSHGIAHGDLQHGNIMVERDETGAISYQSDLLAASPIYNLQSDNLGTRLKLVDYDGMYIPDLKGYASNELGHRNYQHPDRSKEQFGPDLDNFSGWLIYLSLKCLSLDPTLWQTLRGGDECLLLRQSDLVKPTSSYAFHVLETHFNAEINANSRLIRYLLTLPVEQIPAIDQPIKIPPNLPEIYPEASLPEWMQDKATVPEAAGCRYAWMACAHCGHQQEVGGHESAFQCCNCHAYNADTQSVPRPDPQFNADLADQLPTTPPFWMRHDAALGPSHSTQAAALSIIVLALCCFLLYVLGSKYFPTPSLHPVAPNPAPAAVYDAAESAMSAAASYYESGNLQEAIREYSEAVRSNPKLQLAYIYRAVCYDQLKEYDKAIADYSKAIAIDPHDPAAYSGRGDIYSHMGQFQKAIADCTKALSIDSSHLAAHWYRGNAYASLGQYQRAIEDYTATIKLNPGHYSAFYNRGNAYYSLGRYKEALKNYDQAIMLYPEYLEALNNRGNAHGALGQYGKAVEDLTQVINMDPVDTAAYMNRALAFEHMGQFEKAIHDLSECIRLDPINAQSHARRALLYKKIGKGELARLDGETARKLGHR